MAGLEYHLTMKDLPEELRPRERLQAAGAAALSNAELLALIIGSGTKRESALMLAQRLLAEKGGLRFLATATFDELCRVEGIGVAKAAQIKAALELGKRLVSLQPEMRPSICSPRDASALVLGEMSHLDREHFRVILLNTKNQVLGVAPVSVGSLNSSLVHPREVFKEAVRRNAAAIILVHNHPSGDPTPSAEDIEVTKRLVEAGKLLGIEVLDHIIIGECTYASLRERSLVF